MPNKRFYEKYAKESLEFFYESNNKNFSLSECPDLQNIEDGIGIEVTRGISEYTGRLTRLATECMEKNLPLESRVDRANKIFRKNFLGVMHENLGFVIANPENADDCAEIHVREIIEKIKTKTEKLERLYKKFEWNCLYVFAEYPLKSKHIWILSDLLNAEKLDQYSIYFINALDRIYIINTKDDFKFQKHKYTAKELADFTEKANQK
jgi:hypothetical protein